jgi:hypothetical protein
MSSADTADYQSIGLIPGLCGLSPRRICFWSWYLLWKISLYTGPSHSSAELREAADLALFASRRCSTKASVKVKAAHTIKPTVTELPTRNRGAYLVSYVINAIQALKAYLDITVSQYFPKGNDMAGRTYAIALVEPRMSLRSRLSPEVSSFTIVCRLIIQSVLVTIYSANRMQVGRNVPRTWDHFLGRNCSEKLQRQHNRPQRTI